MVVSTMVEQPDVAAESPAIDDPDLRGKIDYLVAQATARCNSARLPVATYRLQLNSQFRFSAAQPIISYLDALGISEVYASPLLQAAPGSLHGYDIVDHSRVNAEIGTLDELHTLAAELRAREMGLLMDVVPNHMCASPDLNGWWRDVLENGQSSLYATFFDIDWQPLKPDLVGKVLLPVLEDQYGKVLEDGLLRVEYREGALGLAYHERNFPLTPQSWLMILDWRIEALQEQLGADDPHLLEYLSILAAIRNLPGQTETDLERREERHREKETSKRRLHALSDQSPIVAEFIAENARQINGQSGNSQSFDRLDQLVGEQAYRLSYWRAATDEINYRRFFDINELAAICMERPEVFEATHEQIFSWVDQGIVTGLRIDHPDGLYDPPAYLRKLQERRFLQYCRAAAKDAGSAGFSDFDANAISWNEAIDRTMELWREGTSIPGSELARPIYVVVEKILEHGEHVPQDWSVNGTVGYEFLNTLGGLFVDPAGHKLLSTIYTRFTGESHNFRELEYSCKRLIARMSMASELHVLGYQLDRMSERNRWTRDFTLNSLIEAVQEVVSCFSVYRTYVHDQFVLERDRQYIDAAVARAKRRNPAMNVSVFDFLRDVLLLKHSDHADAEELETQRRFVGKFQQLTGPIMAKAVEDTAFYRYNRLVSLNEVGGEPARFGCELATFHQLNSDQLPRLSHGLLATTTHDTKRSEDVRARINVLSEVPREWRERVTRWARWNRRMKTNVDGEDAPSRNDEYLLYQTLVGVWPGSIPTGTDRAEFVTRIEQYLLKVAREAKVHTSWINQNEAYEQALLRFVRSILGDTRRGQFLEDLDGFAARVTEHGYWNSLANCC
jgi:(1->4)-alpha-D-glucan 1-alpha-D-glucosylmutase